MKSPAPKAIAAFKAEVAQWAERLRVKPRGVRVQRMTRKWASCSTAGIVCFSMELLSRGPTFRRYVIVHELLHLRVPNHGRLFKALLRAYLPEGSGLAEKNNRQKNLETER